jgi:K+-sensing histidine kinase KdpD
MKSRFLSNMSHEFRTPLNSIRRCRACCSTRRRRAHAEQEKQVAFIAKAADDLTELVDDLLDLAKVEAGKIEVRPVEFDGRDLFGALRGMLRPLLVERAVAARVRRRRTCTLYADEGKVSQILRNFISNALKFTERGEVRVSAARARTATLACVRGRRHGHRHRPEDQSASSTSLRRSPIRCRKGQGTGLGLPLVPPLARLLGRRGRGSTARRGLTARRTSATLPIH